MVTRFLAAESARAALLRDEPAPSTDTPPSEPAAAGPEAEPDTAPDAHPDDLPPLPLEIAIAKSQAADVAPDAEPDLPGTTAGWMDASAPDLTGDGDAISSAAAPNAEPDDLASGNNRQRGAAHRVGAPHQPTEV